MKYEEENYFVELGRSMRKKTIVLNLEVGVQYAP